MRTLWAGLLLAVLAAVAGALIIWYRQDQPARQEITMPGPLRGSLTQPAGNLTSEGVWRETNQHRQQAGLPALAANSALNQAAAAKLQDMLAGQYFDHVGRDGRGPADWVEGAGYQYLRVGENLALGNFASEAELVEAWMGSPGHRANILAANFTEIGVAVGQGLFEGKQTWLAVQEFGLPAATCPTPEDGRQEQFTALTQEADQKVAALEQEQAALEAQRDEIETAEEQAAFNERVREYNRGVEELRQLEASIQQLVRQLNQQIQQYNACLKQNTN